MGRQRKTLQELTIKDNFMFAAVMLEAENAKGLLELALGVKVDHVIVDTEKSIVYNPEYKGVRLDVYLKDDKNTHFNVEMQATSQTIEKRARYYHSQIDMELLAIGGEYENLADSYVMFICDYDPLRLKKYRYTVRKTLVEDAGYTYVDGSHTVFLSTVGTNEGEVPEALVKFLKFVAADLDKSEEDYGDEFVRQLQNSVKKIKINRDMGAKFMMYEEMMRKEYNAGREDGRIEGKIEGKIEDIFQIINAKFAISNTISEKINLIDSEEVLDSIHLDAALATSLEEFETKLEKELARLN